MPQVICVWLLIDDLTGKVLSGLEYTFKVIPSEGKLLVKSDGYFVWVCEKCEKLEVTITSKYYKAHHQTIICQELDPKNPVITVRLFPNQLYEQQSQKTISGKITVVHQEVVLIPKLDKSLMKFGGMQDPYQMKIHRLVPLPINQLNLMIIDELVQCLEIFQGQALNDFQLLKLNKPLEGEYKLGSEVVRVYRSISDQEGRYVIVLDDFYDFKSYWLAYMEQGKLIKKLESID